MSKKPRSTTKHDTTLVDRIFNLPGHYVAEISDGKNTARHRANGAKEAEKQVKKKWERLKKK